MEKEQQDVNTEESQSNEEQSSDLDKEQEQTEEQDVETPETQPVSEDVKTSDEPSEDLEKVIQERDNYKRAVQEERERRKKLETQRVEPVKEDNDLTEFQKDYLKTQADAKIAMKMATDPAFKDRVDLVIKEMEKDPMATVEEADNRVKSSLLDNILKYKSDSKPSETPPNQIKPSAVSEPKPEQKDYSLDDLVKGKVEGADPAYVKAIKLAKGIR